MDISQETREKLLRMAYENGYNAFEYSHIDMDNLDDQDFYCIVRETSEYSQTFNQVENHFGFEKGKHDWDNFGIYGIIEDSSVCFEAGARDALEDNEFNPSRVSHMWG
jgi:hypothetical protein